MLVLYMFKSLRSLFSKPPTNDGDFVNMFPSVPTHTPRRTVVVPKRTTFARSFQTVRTSRPQLNNNKKKEYIFPDVPTHALVKKRGGSRRNKTKKRRK